VHAESMPRAQSYSNITDPGVSPEVFRLSEQDVDEFRKLVHHTSGVWMTPELAAGRARSLLMLTRVLLGPLPEEDGSATVRTSSVLPGSFETR